MSGGTGFRRLAGNGYLCLVEPGLESGLRELGLLEAGAAQRRVEAARGDGGRAPAAVVSMPGSATRVHLRSVRHGGLLGNLWRGRILGMARPVAELRVLQHLLDRGAPVPQPALVSGVRRAGLWIAVLGTVYEERTIDGARLLENPPCAPRRVAAARAAGRAVRRLHDAGCRHADLQIRNLLFRERATGFEVVVVDLDRARLVRGLSAARRMAELMRLVRSLRKRDLLGALGPRGLAAGFAAYTDGDRTLRRALRRHLPYRRAELALHALAYRD